MSFIRNVGETDESLRARMQEKAKSRFGRLAKELGDLGELRRQKKEPHTEVLYVWIPGAEAALLIDGTQPMGHVLRSINNCTNDQLTQAIRLAGLLLSEHKLSQADAELALDMMYKELGRRVK
ncbi:MAG TPA: hypothetical protein VIY48_01945 [Candidatus Paceibacterota bacterium]